MQGQERLQHMHEHSYLPMRHEEGTPYDLPVTPLFDFKVFHAPQKGADPNPGPFYDPGPNLNPKPNTRPQR